MPHSAIMQHGRKIQKYLNEISYILSIGKLLKAIMEKRGVNDMAQKTKIVDFEMAEDLQDFVSCNDDVFLMTIF